LYDGQPVTTKDLKKVALPNRDETLQNAAPIALPAPGMKDIKRMELWVQWPPLIPVELRKDWFFRMILDPGWRSKYFPNEWRDWLGGRRHQHHWFQGHYQNR
jgi:hypothetical protein